MAPTPRQGWGVLTSMSVGNVSGRARDDWEFKGTAILEPERWDFNWEWAQLVKDLWYGGVSLDRKDLRGRERRTALGWTVPGKPFFIAMTGPMQVHQSARQQWATFST